MTVAEKIMAFNDSLQPPKGLPSDVVVMNPYNDKLARSLAQTFYQKYYNDFAPRTILFGINPGRFGGGITGVPFTDPIKLEEDCEIPNPFEKRPELSSRFIYEVIHAFGGPATFYQKYFISALSPLGFTRGGINLNYYDIKNWRAIFENYAVDRIRDQQGFPVRKEVAYCIGQGQNLKFLEAINEKHRFFNRILTVPHPRWVMQYRLKRKKEFIQQYIETLRDQR